MLSSPPREKMFHIEGVIIPMEYQNIGDLGVTLTPLMNLHDQGQAISIENMSNRLLIHFRIMKVLWTKCF